MVLYSSSEISNCLLSLKTVLSHIGGDHHFCYKSKVQFSLHNLQSFSLKNMATLRNKGKLAAILRETPENTRRIQSQNTFHPGMAEEYISQVSEETAGRVSKKPFTEFSCRDSRILGALSKFHDLLLNPQNRKVQILKKTFIKLSMKEKWQIWREINTSPSISSFIDRVFSIFRQKNYGSNPSKMDIKVVISASTQKIIT